MTARLGVLRTPQYERDLQAIHDRIERDNADAAMSMLLRIEDQVDNLADPNFPRRRGRVLGTQELVVHPNYVVVLRQIDSTVVALAVMHVARQYP